MFTKHFFLLFVMAFSLITVDAQITPSPPEDDATPKYVNEFLQIGVGARALGMSLAQVATVNDVTSGYWNPAGLLGIRSDLQIAAMHSEYFAGIAKYDYAAIGKSLDSVSAASISFIRFGVDDIPNTTDLIDAGGNIDYDRITTFSAADYAFVLSYARNAFSKNNSNQVDLVNERPTGTGLRWGANAKIIYRQVGDFANAWGFGLDAGIQYDWRNWKLGVMGRDITSTFNAWSYSLDQNTIDVFTQTGNEIPQNSLEIALPRVIIGGARNFQWKKVSLLAELNADLTTDGQRNVLVSAKPVSIDPHIGFDLGYNNVIFLRMGAGNVQRVKDFDGSESFTWQPNMGLGLRIKQLQLDYALSDIGNQSDVLYSNVFSLRYDLYKPARPL
ncbi:MAG: hypothetical protein SH856_10890 [Flavobacteriales bacterium]|nr:hypothetical protein [Flavobacteriales bacterium]